MKKRECPQCSRPMKLGIRWSQSRKIFQVVWRCDSCKIGCRPKRFR